MAFANFWAIEMKTQAILGTRTISRLLALLGVSAAAACCAAAEDIAIKGKGDWLFVRHEITHATLDNSARRPRQLSSTTADLSTTEGDFVELSFDRRVDHLNYLSARVVADGSNKLTLETYGPEAVGRKFTADTPGDDLAHALKFPLSSSATGVTRVRIHPGVTKSFALTDVKVCRYPQDGLR